MFLNVSSFLNRELSKLNMAESAGQVGNKGYSRQKNKVSSDHTFKKRLPARQTRQENDIFVTNKTNFKGQLSKCEKLLDADESEVVIHGLGAAVQRAINLALRLKEKYQSTCEIDVNTETVTLVDDLEPVHEDADYETQRRQNSAVHIRVYRTVLHGTG